MRRWMVTLAVLGAVLVLAAVLRPSVAVPLYGAGLVLLFGCVGWLLRDSDVLADEAIYEEPLFDAETLRDAATMTNAEFRELFEQSSRIWTRYVDGA